jgi:hypothetical protein
LAAVATHTALIRPSMRATAFDFFAAREREMYESLRALTERFLTDAAAAHAYPFWDDRDFLEVASPDDIQPSFERLRREAELRVRKGEISVEERPAVSGCEIVFERRLVEAHSPEGVRYLHDVDVVALIELAPIHQDVGKLFDAYVGRLGPVAMPDFLRALSTALARGWLVWV